MPARVRLESAARRVTAPTGSHGTPEARERDLKIARRQERAEESVEQRLALGDERCAPVHDTNLTSTPRVMLVASIERSSTTAVPSSSGCASGAGELDPFESEIGQWQRAEERRRDAERMNRGTDIMDKSRQRQRCRSRPAAEGRRRLEDGDVAAGARERDRSGETVGAGTDNDGCGAAGHGVNMDG